MLKPHSLFSTLLLSTMALAVTPLYALAPYGQPELTIYNAQGSAPVTDINYWLTDVSGNIDCRGNQGQGVPISLGAYQTVVLESDMSAQCQAAKVSNYVLHVQGNFLTTSWPYTAYPKSGAICRVVHDYTSWPFTTIHLTCQ